MRIQLSEHFTYKKLIRYVLPSIVMMIFTSIYGVVDGLFISNFAGKEAFAAINLIMPFLMGMGCVGFMIGTGGSALVGMTLGEGKTRRANEYFSMLVWVTVLSGILLTVIGLIFLRPIALLMGATELLIEDCLLYGRIMLTFQTAFMLQNIFQSFFATAEKPQLGLIMTVAAGITNIALDALFVAVFHWGITGAAVATVISQLVGGVFPILYFARKNSSLLRLTKTRFNGRALLRVCMNGSSELMTNLSASVVGILYNRQLLRLAAEDGVAAYGVIMYLNFIFIAIFFGYSIGTAPIISYHYGAGNHKELKSLLKKSLTLISLFGLTLTLLAELFSSPLSRIFVGYDQALFQMTRHGLRLYAVSFLLCGFNIFGSAFFTALNNGAVSAGISFLRTMVFQIATLLLLPGLLGIDGIWLSITIAELLTLAATSFFLLHMRTRYHYAG